MAIAPLITHGKQYKNPPSLLCAAMINTMTKSSSGKRGFTWLIGYGPSWREARTGTQVMNLEATTEAVVMAGL